MKIQARILALSLAGAIALCAVTAGAAARSVNPDDVKKANEFREKESERLMAPLIARCKKMESMQADVLNNTKALNNFLEINPDQKFRDKHKQISRELAKQQLALVAEATTVIALLYAADDAVAFPEVFEQVRADMKLVKTRLLMGIVSSKTQDIQRDIIDTLKEMVTGIR